MRRAYSTLKALLIASSLLTACRNNGLDRLIDGRDEQPAYLPVLNGSPDSTSIIETYRFEGVVRDCNHCVYYGNIRPGDPVRGTFQIDFRAPLVHETPTTAVYQWAFMNLRGTVGNYRFDSYLWDLAVENNDLYDGMLVDTAPMGLDVVSGNLDYFLLGSPNLFQNISLDNLRDLDRFFPFERANSLWFEWLPMTGQGFNCSITSLRRVPTPVARPVS